MDGAALGFTQDGSLWVKDRKGIKRFHRSKNEYFLEGDLCPTTPQPDPYHAIEYHMDVKGNIWAGSAQDDRLCYFDVETLEVSIFELDYDLNRFSLSPDGSVWAASEKGYIANFTLDSLNKEAYDQIPMIKIGGDAVRYPLHPLRIEVSSDGAVWVFAEYSGLYRYDGKAWKYYGLPNLEDPSAFAIDTKGHVWAGVTNVVLKHDGIKWTEYPIPTEFNRSVFPSHMVVAPDGIIWFANNSSMLSSKSASRFDGANWTHFAEVFPDTSFIEKIIFAPDGAVWLINYYHWARYKQ
jgi:streptogramin lyase